MMLVAKNCRKTWGIIAAGVSVAIVIGIAASQARAQQAGQAASAAPASTGNARIDYNWDVRPILSDNCFRCHGPDSKSRQAGLRLDQKEAAYAQAITPGKPEESELIRRITSPDPSYRMPPSYSARSDNSGWPEYRLTGLVYIQSNNLVAYRCRPIHSSGNDTG